MSAPTLFDDIKRIPLEDEMKQSYLDYAMSVIVARALPDARDGFKTVHRRILYVLKRLGFDHTKPHRKSALIVGEVMGKYHPHGDSAIYETMVRMAQDFSMSMILIDGQGNFGSIDGDSAAAMRYTEARMAKISKEILADLDCNTVAFRPNYDGSLQEPTVLPTRVPTMLLNGTSGIAVGMATNIPPHNLGELLDACCALVENPHLELAEIMEFVKGPDFPTGGQILGMSGILNAFRTGRGSIVMRGKASIEDLKSDKEAIVITEIPYQVNKAKLVEKIGELSRDKVIEGIGEIRDESNRHGIRVVVEIKRDGNGQVILNQLYKHTQLQMNFPANVLALVKGVPQTLGLQASLTCFLEFRYDVIVRRTRYFLEKARDKAHILLGFALALSHIDHIITLIKAAADRKSALATLMHENWDAAGIKPYLALLQGPQAEAGPFYRLSEVQANAILDLRLHKLTGMEQEEIKKDLQSTMDAIQEYIDILSKPERVRGIMIEEFQEIKATYPTPRRSEILPAEDDIEDEDLIPSEEMVVTISFGGYIKRVPLSTYRAQLRGGKGRSGMTMKEEDYVQDIIVANTHDRLLFFTNIGQVYRIPVYQLPVGTPQAKGRAIINVLPIEKDEKITSILDVSKEMDDTSTLLFITSKGQVRRNAVSDFERIQSNGKRAMVLEDGETLMAVKMCKDDNTVLLNTKKGLFIRFDATDVRIFSGRTSTGVRGIKLAHDDSIISASVLEGFNVAPAERALYLRARAAERGIQPGEAEDQDSTIEGALSDERVAELQAHEQYILTITDLGFGKRTSGYEYRTTGRGGQGANAILLSAKNGHVANAFPVIPQDQIMLITNKGRLLRCGVNDIRIAGRRTQGVILMRLEKDERVVNVTRIEETEEEHVSE